MSSAEFYRLTPRQYKLLMKRHQERTEQEELLAGTIASVIANYAGKVLKEGTVLKPSDFMPTLRAKLRAQERALPKDAVADKIRIFLWSQAKAHGYRTPDNGA